MPAMSVGPRSVAGSVNAWRAIRRAVTPLQVSEAAVVDFEVTDHILPGSADIGHIGDGGLGDGTGRIGPIRIPAESLELLLCLDHREKDVVGHAGTLRDDPRSSRAGRRSAWNPQRCPPGSRVSSAAAGPSKPTGPADLAQPTR